MSPLTREKLFRARVKGELQQWRLVVTDGTTQREMEEAELLISNIDFGEAPDPWYPVSYGCRLSEGGAAIFELIYK